MSQAADALMGIFGYKRVKMSKCRICRSEYQKRSMTHKVCGPACAEELARRDRARKERSESRQMRNEIREAREKLKSRMDYQREAQAAVNAYVRERDKDLPCISCGRHHQGQWHAGHYLSRGAHPELALEPLNIYRQCAPCNTHLSGNQIEMRKGIIARYGVERVEWLEGPHQPKKYTINELIEIKKEYKQKLKDLQRG